MVSPPATNITAPFGRRRRLGRAVTKAAASEHSQTTARPLTHGPGRRILLEAMKAIRFHACGGPEVLRLEEIPVPQAQPGEVLIRVQAAGVNFLDAYQRMGLYKTPLPFVPGHGGSGLHREKRARSQAETRDSSGVGRTSRRLRAFAAIPAWKVVELPEEVDARTGAAALLQGMTAEYLCETTYPARAGDVALVHAGAGGVGLLLIQLLKQKGVTVYTTVSTPKRQRWFGKRVQTRRFFTLRSTLWKRSEASPKETVFTSFTIPLAKRPMKAV